VGGEAGARNLDNRCSHAVRGHCDAGAALTRALRWSATGNSVGASDLKFRAPRSDGVPHRLSALGRIVTSQASRAVRERCEA
jgi:hypothetical protein